MQDKLTKLTIVVPCYNEEEVLTSTIDQLSGVLKKLIKADLISIGSMLLFVDDGSKDDTWQIISKASTTNSYVTGLKLARNVGHQTALLAGLEIASKHSDCVISIDADLQDDINVIPEFIQKHYEGNDIVFGVRQGRETDTFFKRTTAQGYYRIMNKLGIPLVYNHADYRLMSKRALIELIRYQEEKMFLRGIIPLIGLKTTEVYYDRKERIAGETKYPLKKMLSFALDGITSFTVAPIRLITYLGFLVFFISAVAGSYAIFQKLIGNANEGWTSLMISIWLIGGLQLMGIGIIGEYIGRVFIETKKRPKYAVDVDLYSKKYPFHYLRPKQPEIVRTKKLVWKK
ncbi:glycosyltransferase family 2 protein [Aquibacillus salsiterrae]|uniref:Glycosyltransferase family 2 protein n=1 Tax=Aquibacillus salsiterrae TaxID=2950439 RepID=A0A9X4AHN3_9BACI|nr:glycosyltransferase family 2 protein [Aquibacillus salsiterrae]MDC3418510.1 glycosyltransferase family 2 protein [Aquibacillus salsiterrae]